MRLNLERKTLENPLVAARGVSEPDVLEFDLALNGATSHHSLRRLVKVISLLGRDNLRCADPFNHRVEVAGLDLSRQVDYSEDLISSYFGFAKVRAERLSLPALLGAEHHTEDGHEYAIGLTQRDVAVLKELSCSVVQNGEDRHFDELSEPEGQTDDMAFSDGKDNWTLEEAFVVGDNLLLISE
jgi:hypothetical protein